MNKSTRRTAAPDAATPRERADLAVAELAAREADARAALENLSATRREEDQVRKACGGRTTHAMDLKIVLAQIPHAEAEDAERVARAKATAACDAADIAEGCQLARMRDAACLLADLAPLEAEDEALRAKLATNAKAFAARVGAAAEANDVLAARRLEANLPPPARVPEAPYSGFGFRPGPKDLIAALEARIADGVTYKSNTEKANGLRGLERELRATLEEARRKAEKEAAELLDEKRWRAETRVADAKREAEKHAKWAADGAAEQKRIDELAAAHRVREAAADRAAKAEYAETNLTDANRARTGV